MLYRLKLWLLFRSMGWMPRRIWQWLWWKVVSAKYSCSAEEEIPGI